MSKLLSQKIIPIILVVAILASQVILPLQLLADNNLLNYNNPGANGKNPYQLSLKSLKDSPELLTSVLSCTGITNTLAGKLLQVNDLFKKKLNNLTNKLEDKLKNLLKSKNKTKAINDEIEKIKKTITSALSTAAIAVGWIPQGVGAGIATGIQTGIDNADKFETDAAPKEVYDDSLLAELERDAKQKVEDDNKKELKEQQEKCFNGIAVALAKRQLTLMTKQTMNWVNSGFNGDPMYVTNVTSLLDSVSGEILQNELAKLGEEGSIDHPYGRDFARSQILAQRYKGNINNALRQDLTDYLKPGATPESFSEDFSEGGWDGWFAFTQKPENNPLGFTIKATELIGRKRNEAVQQTADEIARNGGYLDQKECAEWAGEDDTQNPDGSPKCLQWKTVTPGSNIKTKVDTHLNTPERQIELVKTIDDALNSLFAVLLNKFTTQGLYGLRSADNDFSGSGSGGFGINQIFDADGNSLTANTGNAFTTNVGYFSLTSDIGNKYTDASLKGKLVIEKRGILQVQYDYIKLLKDAQVVLDKVVPTIGKLDYCIPGPNPNWFTNSTDVIDEYSGTVSLYAENEKQKIMLREMIADLYYQGNELGENLVTQELLDALKKAEEGSLVPPPIKLEDIQKTVNAYELEVSKTYGPDSPMQTQSLTNPNYLKMSVEGLNITKDLASYDEAIKEAKDEYKQAVADTTTSITRLNVIKDKVNKIIDAAQKRRTAERVAKGKPAMKAICLAVEKITYLDDNGVLK